MKAINIYTLTRVNKNNCIQQLERQLSERDKFLTIKEWEVQSLKAFCEKLLENMENAYEYSFFYSFIIPKLGKEFDLLRVSDETVINIELKSGNVSDEAIKKQLEQNRYYLQTLGKNIRSYTFISNQNRLVRLTNSLRLVEADWDGLVADLKAQTSPYEGHIEDLFKEEDYLISPLTDPERFLQQEYFLTSQQKDIRNRILKRIKLECEGENKKSCYQGFTGLPGTGKTLLLYDIAFQLSWKNRVCVLHFGSFPEELKKLNDRLKRIDFYSCREGIRDIDFSVYQSILVDEGHWMDKDSLLQLQEITEKLKIPMIFSYDLEDAISNEEKSFDAVYEIEKLRDFEKYQMTNRIRTNSEISSFIHNIMQLSKYHQRKRYPSVSLAYANTMDEARLILANFKSKGFTYIKDTHCDVDPINNENEISVLDATCKEFEKVVMILGNGYYYDSDDYLRGKDETSNVRNVFHGLSRAKSKLCVIVYDNEELFERVLAVVQKV